MKLKWKKALITWWASWIWLEIAKEFSNQWAEVYIADINDEAWKKAEKIIEGSKFINIDVSSENSWIEWFKEIWEIDILVNNAWIIWNPEKMWAQNPEHISIESWSLIHRINLDSVMLWCKYAIKNMKNRKNCSIINMWSRSWKVWVPENCAYASTKSAIRNYSKSVALYCQKMWYDIRCNTVNPASIMTDMWETILNWNDELYKKLVSDIPMSRFWTPEEVAKTCLFLASEDSSYITWSEIDVDWWILSWTKTSPWEK